MVSSPIGWLKGTPHLIDCGYPAEHASAHREHEGTGRLVCIICHTPSYVLAARARAAEIGLSDAAPE